jgi:hypothetical protein
MPNVITELEVTRVDLVDRGANFDKASGDGAHILLWKRDGGIATEPEETMTPNMQEQITKAVEMAVAAAFAKSAPKIEATRATVTAPEPKSLDEAIAAAMAAEKGLSKAAATARVAKAFPSLYVQHRQAVLAGTRPAPAAPVAVVKLDTPARDRAFAKIADAADGLMRLDASLSRPAAIKLAASLDGEAYAAYRATFGA